MSTPRRQHTIEAIAREITWERLERAELLALGIGEGLSRLAERRERATPKVALLLDKAMAHLFEAARLLREARKRAKEN